MKQDQGLRLNRSIMGHHSSFGPTKRSNISLSNFASGRESRGAQSISVRTIIHLLFHISTQPSFGDLSGVRLRIVYCYYEAARV